MGHIWKSSCLSWVLNGVTEQMPCLLDWQEIGLWWINFIKPWSGVIQYNYLEQSHYSRLIEPWFGTIQRNEPFNLCDSIGQMIKMNNAWWWTFQGPHQDALPRSSLHTYPRPFFWRVVDPQLDPLYPHQNNTHVVVFISSSRQTDGSASQNTSSQVTLRVLAGELTNSAIHLTWGQTPLVIGTSMWGGINFLRVA